MGPCTAVKAERNSWDPGHRTVFRHGAVSIPPGGSPRGGCRPDRPWPSRTRLIREAFQPPGHEPRTPLRHHVARHPNVLRDLTDREALGAATQSATATP